MVPELPSAASSDQLQVVDVAALSSEEAAYVRAARAANTLRGYRSDWAEWCAWSKSHDSYPEIPASERAWSPAQRTSSADGLRPASVLALGRSRDARSEDRRSARFDAIGPGPSEGEPTNASQFAPDGAWANRRAPGIAGFGFRASCAR